MKLIQSETFSFLHNTSSDLFFEPIFRKYEPIILCVLFLLFSLQGRPQMQIINDSRPATLGIEQGTMTYNTADFQLDLLKSSQTVSALHPTSEPTFDFTPHEWIKERDKDGYYHLGDLNFRIRTGDGQWETYSTASKRASIKTLAPQDQSILAAADLNPTLPPLIPLHICRFWQKDGDQLVLRFKMENTSSQPIEIGALGIPMIFNNNFNGKELDQAHAENVFFDPYIGMDAGYLQVIRLSGHGPVLLVVPEGKTPFEAYRPLPDDPTRQGFTFEGFHEWMVHSKAYADKEWKGLEQWNIPTSKIVQPGEIYIFGVKFLLAEKVENIEKTLIENKRPVAVGIPGYVIPQDVDAKLFLNYPKEIAGLEVEPEGALDIKSSQKTKNGWISYSVNGKTWGRARLVITYSDGLQQSINYKVIKPESQVVADNGKFLTTKQWFEQPNDLFHRSPSVITYDYEKQQQVTQDRRAWICGLGDEGGSGSWLNAIMKQLVQPDAEEIKKLETFVNQTIWGGIQYSDGPLKYGVRKSMFYYEPDSMPPGTYDPEVNYAKPGVFPSWNLKEAESVGRSYNYPHVAAAHWVMYRLARNYEGLVKQQSWDWYLLNAYQTSMAMVELAPYYAQFGQMEGSIFIHILEDLKAEGLWEFARKLEEKMKERTDHWATLNYPFGSEMPWDSTGQEEVYMWSKYFGFNDKAETTLKAILAYMPTIPHWAYNGNARRYWDFLYGGKLSRVERQIHHYGSGLNAIPVLEEYREKPDDLYLLRVGYGGLLGTISNITQDGFAPAAFHSFPSTLEIDGISGDYGSGFFGYAVNSATFITHHDEFGWLAFGGNLEETADNIKVEITTAAKSKVFVAPLKLWLTLDAGQFKSVIFNKNTKEVELGLNSKNEFTEDALLRIVQPEGDELEVTTSGFSNNSRGQLVIPLKSGPAKVILK